MDYLDALFPGMSAGTSGRESLWKRIQHSEVRRQLEALGYETVAFSSGLAGTELTDADVYITAGSIDENLGLTGVSPFESMLLQTTLLRLASDGVVALPRLLPGMRFPYEVHRSRIRNTFAGLQDLPQSESPRLVFAHIIAPHPPFVFAADGSPVTPDVPFSLRFTSVGQDLPSGEYIEGYRNQVAYVNSQLEAVVTHLLEDSDVPPVIVLFGDHGPDSNSGRVSYIQERMTNLIAIRAPTGDAGLYPDITLVNVFRVIFNEVFGADYPLLPDRVLYSEYDTPYDFRDVTDKIVAP
jgi:hypothetical protein